MSTVNKSSFIDRKGWIFRVTRLWRNFKTTPYLRGLHQRLSSAVSSHQRWLHSDPEVSSFNDKSRNPHLTFALVTESTQIWSHSSQRRYKTTKTTSEEVKKNPDDCVRPDSRDWTLVSTLSLSPSSKSREQFPGTSWTKGLTHFYSTHMPARRGGSNRRLGARSEGLRQIYNSKLCSRIFFFSILLSRGQTWDTVGFFFLFWIFIVSLWKRPVLNLDLNDFILIISFGCKII